jgi:Dolichyl-phosphate-mannose-protein mannosyltransferase
MSRWTSGVVAIAAAALALRVTALDFGLPAVYNPDEISILSRALAFAKGDPNPHNFLYPTFFFYALFAWLGAYFALARITGAVTSLNAFQQRFFIDPSGVYLAGRALGAVCGAVTTGVTAVLGRTLFDAPTGLAAAALLAVSPLAVQDAHYVKHDVPVTLGIAVALWRLARCWPEGGARGRVPHGDLVLGAAACGVAWSTHYYSVFLAVPLALTAIDARRAEGWRSVARELALAGAVAGAVFFALSPFLLVEPATAWRDIVANRQIVVDRAASHGLLANLQRYVTLLVRTGATLPVAALAGIGAVAVLFTDRRRALLLLSFPVPFLLFIANTVPASRYLNPVLPVVALLAAVAIRHLARALAPRRAGVAMAALTALAGAVGLADSVRVVRFFGQDDTRTLAQRVIETQAGAGATVLVQPYSVMLTQSRESLEESLAARLGSLDRLSTRARLRLAVSPWPRPAYRLLWLGDGGLDEDKIYVGYAELGADPLAALQARRVEYVVLKRYNVADPAVRPLAEALARGARRVATISPYRDDVAPGSTLVAPFLHNTDTAIDPRLARPGPIVDIYRLE